MFLHASGVIFASLVSFMEREKKNPAISFAFHSEAAHYFGSSVTEFYSLVKVRTTSQQREYLISSFS